MHPGLKKVGEPRREKTGLPSQGAETRRAEDGKLAQGIAPLSPDSVQAKETSNDGAPEDRKPISAEKFAYLRAQVHVFRRSH